MPGAVLLGSTLGSTLGCVVGVNAGLCCWGQRWAVLLGSMLGCVVGVNAGLCTIGVNAGVGPRTIPSSFRSEAASGSIAAAAASAAALSPRSLARASMIAYSWPRRESEKDGTRLQSVADWPSEGPGEGRGGTHLAMGCDTELRN